MEVHQFLTSLSYGDAIGDYALEIQGILRKKGYQSEIYSELVDPLLAHHVRPLYRYELEGHNDVLMLIHFSIGSDLGDVIPYYKGKKLLIYHNITPYRWFVDINQELAVDCLIGRQQLRRLKDFCPIALADSEYNRAELQEMGYANTAVLPIRVRLDKFNKKEDPLTRFAYDDNRTNIVVVGRTIPNKKLEDCLKIFACYQKYLNPRSRLIFAGFWKPFESYYVALRDMAQQLELREVVFTGHVRFEELLAYYRLADVVLSMSEHEGFCVPLLEAFHMNVPVVAFGACAVPYTAGEGGILVQEKNFLVIAEMIHRLCSQTALRRSVLNAQQLQLRKQQSFPFEETLIRHLEALQKTEPLYLSDSYGSTMDQPSSAQA